MNEALQLLPVYLAGCRKLLILAGSTYTSRIWCVMEIFTFLQVGKSPEDIEIIAITPGDTAQEKARALNDLTLSFSTFDASQAECYKPEERQTLLAVIERGFGSISGFNSQVRQIIFKGKVKRSATMSFARLPEQSSDEEDGFDSAALEFLGREAAPVRRQKSAGVQETKKRWTGLKTLVKVAPSPRQGPEEAR